MANIAHSNNIATGYNVKDLSNIALAAKKGESRNHLDATVQVLMEKYGMRMNKIIINNYDNNVLLAP